MKQKRFIGKNMRDLKWKFRHVWGVIKGFIPASILCLRYPFLYPRNRFTDRHYNNWKLRGKMDDILKEGKDNRSWVDENGRWQFTSEWRSKKLERKYKLLNCIHKILEFFHAIPYYTELDAMPVGWRKAFGLQMCEEIRRALLDAGGRKALYAYRIEDIKEKWGSLHWYDHNTPYAVAKIVMKYTYISEHTCITCGRPADGITPAEYWMSPYCYAHRPETSKFFLVYGAEPLGEEGIDWYSWKGYVNDPSHKKEDEKNYEEYLEMINKDFVAQYGEPTSPED